MMLFYTGQVRKSETVLDSQARNIPAQHDELDGLRDLAAAAITDVRAGNFDRIGPGIRESWQAKRNLADGVSNSKIDGMIDAAMAAGADGAKICGAGGGGFVLVICPLGAQDGVRKALGDYRELAIRIDPLGSRVVLNIAF